MRQDNRAITKGKAGSTEANLSRKYIKQWHISPSICRLYVRHSIRFVEEQSVYVYSFQSSSVIEKLST